jgi:hypothetical protein
MHRVSVTFISNTTATQLQLEPKAAIIGCSPDAKVSAASSSRQQEALLAAPLHCLQRRNATAAQHITYSAFRFEVAV